MAGNTKITETNEQKPSTNWEGEYLVTYIEDEERASFSGRLRAALSARGCDPTPAIFLKEFNLRADGLAVTVHAARKWLLGDAIPAQARLQVLANWLGVNAAWLRFGDAGNSNSMSQSPQLQPTDLQLVNDIVLLSPANQRIVRTLVESMLREQNESAGYSQAPRKQS